MKLFSAQLLPIPALLRRGLAGAAALLPGLALANPTGGQVVSGQVTITTPNSNGMVVTEGSNSAIVNWQSFSIGGNQYVQFIQPSSSSVILNRVIGNSPSSIFGSMTGNGRVFLINPDGVLFAPGSSVDVGALVASTVNISNSDFLAGHYVFTGGTAGTGVTNNGSITTHQGGFVVLNGDYVHNTGVIQARLGEVVLASGSAMTMTLDQGGLIGYSVDKAALSKQAGVANSGQLLADGGHIIMTAEVAHNLVGTAINNTGLVRAEGISQHDGIIELTASGGDIDNSGTLDVSSRSGNGGSLQLHSDHNIDLQAGTLLNASGAELGGNIQVVAGGAMHLREGALIEGIATKKGGRGGTAELSAHGKFSVAGDVKLGEGGSLTIDPTNVIIANGSGTSSSATYFQQSLQNTLAGGTSVTITASNSITLDALSSGVLDGRGTGANAGGGGSLALDINGPSGTIQFQNTGNSIDVDGNLTLSAGSTGGIINVGNLSAGNIDLIGKTSVTTGNLHASLGSLTINGGNVSTGSIDLQNSQQRESFLSISSTGNVSVNGPITVAGGGGHGTSDSGFGNTLMVDAQISATGNVTVSGNIAVTGRAFTQSSHGGSFSRTVSAGSADLRIQGNKVSLAGVSVSAVGSASFNVSAAKSITISSDVNVSATRATFNSTHTTGSNSFNDIGDASIRLQSISNGSAAGLSITTNGLTATGPYAGVDVTGGTLNLKDGASGKAIVATAFTGGTSTGGSGAYYQHSYGGGNGFVATDFDAAGVAIDRVGSGTTKIGGISVSGPSASLQLQGSGGVTTINGGISVQASGYTVTGSASQFPAFGRGSQIPGGHVRNLSSSTGGLAPPVLVDGTTHWGTARFVAGGSSAATADTLNISGAVTVSGLGQAYVNINAAALTIGGAVTVTASKGSLQGITTSEYQGSDSQFLGSITRSISNSAGTGAATFGQANVTVNIGNNIGDVSIGSLKVRGLSAQASFQGGRNIAITGAASVDGQYGGVAPDYKEVMTLAKNGGGSSTGTTEWVGDNNFLKIGGVTDPSGAVTLGDVSVSGFGFVNLTVHGNSVTMGNVSLTQGTGLFTSTDFTRYSSSYAVTNPGTLIDLHATSGPVQATSLTVNSAGALTQAVELNVTNTYSITAPSYSSVVSGISTLIPPLLSPAPTSTNEVTSVPANLTFSGVSISATDIALTISGSLALTSEALSASKKLTINTGGNLTLSSNTLAAGSSMNVVATGNLTMAGNTMSAGKSLSLNAGSNFSDSGSTLLSPAVTINSTGTLALNNTSISGSPNSGPGSIALTGSAITLNSGLTLSGTNVSLDVTAGDLNLANTINATGSIDLTASGSILATGTVLSGDHISMNAGTGGIAITDSTFTGVNGNPSSTIDIASTGGAITLADSTTINGVDVSLTGTSIVSNAPSFTPAIIATNLSLDATTGNLTLGSSLSIGASNNLTLTADAGSVTVGENLSVGGNLLIDAARGSVSAQGLHAGGNLSINGSVGVGLTQIATAGGSIAIATGTGGLTASDMMAGTALTISATGGVNVGAIQVGVGGSHALSITGTQITTGDIVNTTPSGTIGNGNDMTLTATAGGITTGNITTTTAGPTTDFLTMTATGGAIQTGNIRVEGVSLTASGNVGLGSLVLQSPTPPASTIDSTGGTVTLASLNSNGSVSMTAAGNVQISGTSSTTGDLAITSSGGNIQTGDITGANSIDFGAAGSIATGNLSTSNDLTLTAGTGITLTNAVLAASGKLSLSAGSGDLTATNDTFLGSGISLTSTTGSITLNNSLLSAGSIDVAAGGALGISHSSLGGPATNPAATTIALTAGSDMTIDTATAMVGNTISLNATGSITVNDAVFSGGSIAAVSGTGLSISGSAFSGLSTSSNGAATNIELNANGGDLALAGNTSLTGTSIGLNASGSIAVNDSQLSGGSIAAVAGSGLSFDNATVAGLVNSSGVGGAATTIVLTANGGDMTLDGSTALNGDAVGLFATGSITSTAGSSGSATIAAGALSAQAFNTIDLTQALLEIGTGTAQFGVDSALLQQISQQSGGKIPLPGSGPNAAFKAQTVNLGTIQTQHAGDDLYLYIESQATTSGLGYSIAKIVGAGDALLDYNLFSGNTQVVNVPPGDRPLTASTGTTTPTSLTIDGTVNAPAGLTTLVIGSSVLSAGITIDADAVFSPNDPASVNLVFATTGDVSGADNLHTTGYVFILNQISNPVASLPIQPGDYTPPPTGTLGSPQPSPGDPDDSGVNDANKGTIVQQTSTQGALTSCGGT